MRCLRFFCLVFGAFLAMGVGAATAQSSTELDQFRAKVQEGASRIAQYQQILQNPDMRIQYEAVTLMLKSKDPALVRIAKEHALFSTNPVLRASAVEAIFNAGGTLRIEVTARGDNWKGVLDWVANVGGAHDGRIGNFVFPLGKKDGECWRQFNNKKYCQLQVAGTSVQYAHRYNAGDNSQASLKLGPDGVLRGVMFSNNGSATVSIDLKE